MKVLAIGSHPDDIEIFMYGFLSACLDRGDEIYLAIATDGSLGGKFPGKKLVEKRKVETRRALKKLGDPIFLGFPDGFLYNHLEAQTKLLKLISSVKPDLIITHAPEDYHPDHKILSKYVKNATGFKAPILFADTLLGVNFIPEFYIDITKHFEFKKKAILSHKSQDPKRFLEATKILNRFRSAQCNSPKGHYAEAYRFEKSFPYSDIRQILPPSPILNPYYKGLKDSLI